MKSLFVVLLLAGMAFAQNGSYAGSPVINGVGQPIANASVAIATGNPCGTAPTYSFCNGQPQGVYTGTLPPPGLAAIFTDINEDTAATNPLVTDALGNWTVYAQNGTYWAVIYGYQIIPQVQVITVSNGSGSGGSVNCPTALNGSLAAFHSPTSLGCDPNMGTDFAGNGFSQSWTTLGAVNGFYSLIGGGVDPGTAVKFKLPANTVRLLAAATVPTPYYARVPGTSCAIGQVWQVTGVTTDGNGDTVESLGCLTPGSGVTFQTNTVNNSSQSLLNLIAGSGISLSNTSGGNVQITATSGGTTHALNPSAPTATVNGTPGTTDYKYAIVGCQDPACTATSAMSAVTDVATGAATITSVNSITLSGYADTLYGYRFYKVCRTASSGSPATVGVIATGVGKKFIDTGLAGDGTNCSSLFATNTTILDNHCLSSSSPGVEAPPGTPCGVDAPPATPTAMDDEMAEQFGAPADANSPFWTWINQNGASATWTGGMMTLSAPSRGNADNLNCVSQPVPGSTPYTFVTLMYAVWHFTAQSARINFGFFESGTGKYQLISVKVTSSNAGGIFVSNWTNTSTDTDVASGTNAVGLNPIIFKVQNDGTNLVYFWSPDGVTYQQIFSAAKNSFFTTGPTSVVECVDAANGAQSLDVDYFRRTQ